MLDIEESYKKFVETAKTLASLDMQDSPSIRRGLLRRRRETPREMWEDRYQIHLIGMIEMFGIKYGDPNVVKAIVNFLDRRFFPFPKEEGVDGLFYHLTIVEWQILKQLILEKPEEVISG